MARKPNSPPFKKGPDPRRNTTGLNRGSKWLTSKLDEALRKIGEGNTEPYDDLLIKRVMRKAIIEGDMRAVEHVWNRLEGNPTSEFIIREQKPLDEPDQDNSVQENKVIFEED